MTGMPVTAPAPAGEFGVGLVFRRAWAVFSRNIAKFLPLSAITVVPNLILLIPGVADGAIARTPAPQITAGAVAILGVTGLVWGVLIVITHATVLYGAFQAMRGRSFQIGDSFQKGLSRFFPVIGTSIAMVVCMLFGGILLFFPAFILLSAFFVALPACVVERLGPFQSLGRSRALTKGYRWRIFGIWLVLALVSGIGSNIIGLILAPAGTTITVLVSMVWQASMTAYQAISAAVVYHDLRVAKEGVDIEHIASVFD
jgi:hypothetical protein